MAQIDKPTQANGAALLDGNAIDSVAQLSRQTCFARLQPLDGLPARQRLLLMPDGKYDILHLTPQPLQATLATPHALLQYVEERRQRSNADDGRPWEDAVVMLALREIAWYRDRYDRLERANCVLVVTNAFATLMTGWRGKQADLITLLRTTLRGTMPDDRLLAADQRGIASGRGRE